MHEQQKDLYSKIQRKLQIKCKPALERMQNLNKYETMRSNTVIFNPLNQDYSISNGTLLKQIGSG